MTAVRPPIILVANNPYGHHLLTAQLLDIYQALNRPEDIILLCNGVMKDAPLLPQSWLTVRSFAKSRFGILNHLNLLLTLFWLRWSHPDAVYHLRGFVSGLIFSLSRFFMLNRSRYIYDPRGAFFVEWRESGRSKRMSGMFYHIERNLIRSSVVTIVTSNRFAKLYRMIFKNPEKYKVIYNSTSFAFNPVEKTLPHTGVVRVVYMGTFNHWHDMDEIARVMKAVAEHIGVNRTELHVFTPKKFHDQAMRKFSSIPCAALTVEYIPYPILTKELADKHIGISVVRPTLSTRIASPIKISDYVAVGLLPVFNAGIGDFDQHFKSENSGVLYTYSKALDLSRLASIHTSPNKTIYEKVSHEKASQSLAQAVDHLVNV